MPGLIEELKRRNVIRVGVAYVIVAWIIAQVAELALDSFNAPDWIIQTVLLLLALGLPLALFFAWVFEITPEGIKKESEIDRSQSVTPKTGRKLDRAIIGVLVVAIGFLIVDKFVFQGQETDKAAAMAGAESTVVAIAEDAKSIAVLPFVALSGNESDGYFGKGIAEELINVLAKFPELKVAARTSAFSFAGKDVDLRDVGLTLGVSHVLEGSIRSAGEKLRVTAQLIRTSDGFHLWSETYNSTMKDVFDVQDEIVRNINRTLQIQLGVGAGATRSSGHQVNPQAYQNYLRGLDLWGARGEGNNRVESIKALALATSQDPQFADGWAAYGMSLARSSNTSTGMDRAGHRALTHSALNKALELDPDNTRALAGLTSDLLTQEGNIEPALKFATRAMEIAPNSAAANYSYAEANIYVADPATVRQAYDRAVSLDPLNVVVRRVRAEYLSGIGDYAGTLAAYERCDVCVNDEKSILARAVYTAARRGGTDAQVREAAAHLNKLLRELLSTDPASLTDISFPDSALMLRTTEPAFVDWVLGGPRPDAATLGWMSKIDLSRSVFSDAPMFASLGEYDFAFQILESASAAYFDYLFMVVNPIGRDAWPDEFRRDPRFHAFWQRPNMQKLAEMRQARGLSTALPLPQI